MIGFCVDANGLRPVVVTLDPGSGCRAAATAGLRGGFSTIRLVWGDEGYWGECSIGRKACSSCTSALPRPSRSAVLFLTTTAAAESDPLSADAGVAVEEQELLRVGPGQGACSIS